MQLIDLNQVMLSGLITQITPNQKLEKNLIKHIVINTLRSNIKLFKNEYGKAVLCSDSRNYWRKKVFPHYKSHRKTARERSALDWDLIFKSTNELKEDFKAFFPYKFIEVDGAEADDIIAVLVEKYHIHEKIIIISSDKDFLQLQKFENVTQYNPITKKYMVSDNPKLDLQEKILRGDSGDGIPNILSSDETFVNKQRQSPIYKKQITHWIKSSLKEVLTESQYKNYQRNNTLINFENIPKELVTKIIEEFDNTSTNPKQRLFEYFIEKDMVLLLDCLQDF